MYIQRSLLRPYSQAAIEAAIKQVCGDQYHSGAFQKLPSGTGYGVGQLSSQPSECIVVLGSDAADIPSGHYDTLHFWHVRWLGGPKAAVDASGEATIHQFADAVVAALA